jgi:sugar/nucleoside kinase (ribokinase family)
MMPKVVVAGVASLYVPVGVPDFPLGYHPMVRARWMRAGVSGAGLHVARVLKALGDDTRFCTAVGRDAAGAAIRRELARLGLAGPGAVDAEESTLGVVLVAPDGRRMGLPYLTPTERTDYPFDVLAAEAQGADLLVLTNAKFVRPLVDPARRLGTPIAVDVHLVSDLEGDYNLPWLESAQIVFCSHERLPEPPRAWVARVFQRFPRCQVVGVGLGDQGAIVGVRDGRLVEVSAVVPGEVVSTSGAGDALFATFLHGWLRTSDPVHALRTAVVHAGWKIGHRMPGEVSLTVRELAALRDRTRPAIRLGRWDGRSGV